MRGDLWMDEGSIDKELAAPVPMIYRNLEGYHDLIRMSKAIVSKDEMKAQSYMPKPHEVLKSGYLQQKGKSFGCQKLLYCELKGPLLSMYKKEGDIYPVDIIFCVINSFIPVIEDNKFMIKVCFMADIKEHLRLITDSEAEMKDWIELCVIQSKNLNPEIKYELKETLGTGTFSTVRKAVLKSDPTKIVAVKIISKKNLDMANRNFIMHEITTMNAINHPNIPKIYDFYNTPDKLMLVMQYMKDGELFTHLQKNSILSYRDATKVLHKTLSLLKYLHELKIIHRDIKTENIMIDKDKNGKIEKIYMIDFGLSHYIDSRKPLSQRVGTVGY
jgi:tRNA A-37 threonylcarbamoyl transferase component Bud32